MLTRISTGIMRFPLKFAVQGWIWVNTWELRLKLHLIREWLGHSSCQRDRSVHWPWTQSAHTLPSVHHRLLLVTRSAKTRAQEKVSEPMQFPSKSTERLSQHLCDSFQQVTRCNYMQGRGWCAIYGIPLSGYKGSSLAAQRQHLRSARFSYWQKQPLFSPAQGHTAFPQRKPFKLGHLFLLRISNR